MFIVESSQTKTIIISVLVSVVVTLIAAFGLVVALAFACEKKKGN